MKAFIIAALLFISANASATTITAAEIKAIENFIHAEIDWGYEDVGGEYIYTRVNDRSFAMKFGQDNNGIVLVTAMAEVETNFYGEPEVGNATCEIKLEKKGEGYKINSLKSFCKCESGLQCGEGRLFDE